MARMLGLTTLDTTMALLYDAVVTFSLALTRLQAVQSLRQTPLDCSGQLSWSWGNSLTNYMKVGRLAWERLVKTYILFRWWSLSV